MGIVIGLHGAKGSGKDQFFKAVHDAHPGLDVRKIAYADPIKHEVCRIFNLATEEQYDAFKRSEVSYTLPGHLSYAVSGRQVVREIGMLMRKYDEGQFVRYVEEQISIAPDAIWCITDLRFHNEIESILTNLDGILIKIRRTGVGYDGHVTETEFPDECFDVVVDNNGITLDQYNQRVVAVFNSIIEQ